MLDTWMLTKLMQNFKKDIPISGFCIASDSQKGMLSFFYLHFLGVLHIVEEN